MNVRSYSVLYQRLSRCFIRGSKITLIPSQYTCLVRKFSNWDIVGAICLERKPVITQSRTPLEERYFQYLQKVEYENSVLSDHEKRHLEDLRMTEKLKKGELEDMDRISQQTAQDFEDASIEEFNKYVPNPRITESDGKNDKKSLHRKLDSSLLLLINQKLGNDCRWVLPQATHRDGETLQQTAFRALNEICLSPLQIRLMGNAPVGYYKYKYPKAARGNGVCGAKVFFFKGQVLDKKQYLDFKNSDNATDHMWLTHKELDTVLQPVYGKVIQSFLFPDTFEVNEGENTVHTSPEDDEPDMKSTASN